MSDYAVIKTVTPLTITLDSGVVGLSVKTVGSYFPVVGDRVAVDKLGAGLIVLGVVDSPASRYPGEIIAGGWAVAPAGTLDCLGGSYLRATYPALFAAIGTQYGSVDSTHFNVPNFPVGTYLTGGAPGAASGSATHTLSIGEMPTHDHPITISSGYIGNTYTSDLDTNSSSFGPKGAVNLTAEIGNTGGGAAFPLAPKSVGVRYVIKT